MKKPTKILCAIAALTAFFSMGVVIGVWRAERHAWPERPFLMLQQAIKKMPMETDWDGRIVKYEGKQEVPCPPQDKNTAVILAAGQSNSSNYAGQRYRAINENVINYFNGKCYLASSPLLGADGNYGESWTLLGNKLVQAGLFKRVIIISTGIGGSRMQQWAPGGKLNRLLLSVLADLKPRYSLTYFLWHQGETDYQMHEKEDNYVRDFNGMVESVRGAGMHPKFFISLVSYRGNFQEWSEDNPLRRAQARVVNGKDILAGPDTDLELGSLDRIDEIHFSGTGQEKFTNSYMNILKKNLD